MLAGPANATFSFQNATESIRVDGAASRPVIGDATGDGLDDLVAFVGTQVYVYPRLPAGGFDTPLQYDFLGSGFEDSGVDLKLADVTGDGLADIIVGGSGTSHLAILKSNRLAPATRTLEVYADADVQSKGEIALSDVTGDGRLDIVQVVAEGTSSEVQIWSPNPLAPRRNSKLFRQASALPSSYPGMTGVTVRDMNADHRDDIVVWSNSTNVFSIFYRMPDGGFSAESAHFTGNTVPATFAIADVNGDGRPDAIWSQGMNSPETIQVQLQQASGDFADAVSYEAGDRPAAMRGGDIDNDGDDDLVVLNAGSGIGVYLQQGGTLAAQPLVGDYQSYQFAVGDLDADGCKDLAYVVQDLGFLVFHGNGCQIPAFVAPDLAVALVGHPTAIAIGVAARDSGTQAMAAPLVQLDLSVSSSGLQTGTLPAPCARTAQTATTQRIECLLADMDPGATTALTVPVSVANATARTTLRATVRVESDTAEASQSNNTATVSVKP